MNSMTGLKRSVLKREPPAGGSRSTRTRLRRDAAVAACFLAATAAAHAVTIDPATVLPDAVSYEYFGLNYAENIKTSNVVGVLDYSGGPGCAGICTAATSLGSDPQVVLHAAEVNFGGAGGGYAEAELTYYVQYNNTPGNYAVNLHTSDTLSAIASGSAMQAQAYLAFGQSEPIATPAGPPEFASYIVNETDCSNGCSAGVANYTNPSPFPTNTAVTMAANTPYLVSMFVTIHPGASGVALSASIDPSFSTTAAGGQFVFSPGITSAVPEPAEGGLIAAGLGALALLARRGVRSRITPRRLLPA